MFLPKREKERMREICEMIDVLTKLCDIFSQYIIMMYTLNILFVNYISIQLKKASYETTWRVQRRKSSPVWLEYHVRFEDW